MNIQDPLGMSGSTPDSSTQRWLLAHDIADPKRLQKVWRLMRKEGLPLQYSLYLLHGDRQRVQRLLDQLTLIIDSKRDDLRIYPLGENTRLWGLGTQFNEGSNALTDEIIDRLRRHTTAVATGESETAAQTLSSDSSSKVGIPPRKPALDQDILD